MSRRDYYLRKKYKEFNEKARLLAKADTVGKSSTEIEEIISDLEICFIQCDIIKTEITQLIASTFNQYVASEFRSSEVFKKSLEIALDEIDKTKRAYDQSYNEYIQAKQSLLMRTLNKQKLQKLEERKDIDYAAKNSAEQTLEVFVGGAIQKTFNYCENNELIRNQFNKAPARLGLRYARSRYSGNIANLRTLKNVFDFIEVNTNLPKVDFIEDDSVRFYFKEEYIREIKKAIPKAKRKSKLSRLKAQAASNTEEQRNLSGAIRSEANYKKQFEKLGCCPYCSKIFDNASLTESVHLDHIYPVSKGGQSVIENLVFICRECNKQKSDTTLAKFCANAGLDQSIIVKRLIALDKDV